MHAGEDQNQGAYYLAQYNYPDCLGNCVSYPNATGCEAIGSPGSTAFRCVVHTSEAVASGNGAADHSCWILSKCGEAEPTNFQSSACDATFASCQSTTVQGGYDCQEAFDGVVTGSDNGWAFNGVTPTTGTFTLASAATVSEIRLLSGVDRNDHR